MKKIICTILLLGFNALSCHAGMMKEIKELAPVFDKHGVQGAILIYNSQSGEYMGYNPERCNQGFLPASTFKIPNTLIGLETGTITLDTQFKWDGKPRERDEWNADMDIKQAFKVSCVPVYKELARSIGAKRMQDYIRLLHYGDLDIHGNNIDTFWLRGESTITPFQQIYFLKRLYNKELPVKDETINTLLQVMLKEQTKDYTIWAKTGWSAPPGGINVGWYVGIVKTRGNVYYFVTNVSPAAKNTDTDRFLKGRIDLTNEVLSMLKIIP